MTIAVAMPIAIPRRSRDCTHGGLISEAPSQGSGVRAHTHPCTHPCTHPLRYATLRYATSLATPHKTGPAATCKPPMVKTHCLWPAHPPHPQPHRHHVAVSILS